MTRRYFAVDIVACVILRPFLQIRRAHFCLYTFRNSKEIRDKYCVRGSEWGVGDCAGKSSLFSLLNPPESRKDCQKLVARGSLLCELQPYGETLVVASEEFASGANSAISFNRCSTSSSCR